MTIPVNKISLEVYEHETEDRDKIFLGMRYFFSEEFQLDFEKLFKVENLTGYHNNVIKKYSIEFRKNKETQNLFIYLIKRILGVVSYFDLLERITDDGELYLRLNKQLLIRDGTVLLDNSSDVYKIVIKFLFFNKKVNKIEEIYQYLMSISQN